MGIQKPSADQPPHRPSNANPTELWNAEDASELEAAAQAAGASPADSVGAVEGVDALQQRYALQLQEAEARVLRAQAESENARRRLRRDFEDQLKYANMPLVQDLVDVADNLSRALQAADQTAADNPGSAGLVNGLRMVESQLASVLEKHGCRRIDATPGTVFDPALHSAIQMQAHPEIPANHIAYEARVGFTLYDRVVRPAEVIVSTGTSRD